MTPLYKSLRRFFIYLAVLLLSITVFYAVDGRFETDFISFPTLWTSWFYFLYVIFPFIVLIRLLYRVLIKKTPYTESLNSVVFIICLLIVQFVYWVGVNAYKTILFYEVEDVKATIQSEINTVEATNIDVQFELNKFNKKRSYKVSFTTQTQPTYKTHINIKEYVKGRSSKGASRTLILLTDKKVQEHYFHLVEKSYRNKLKSNDILDFNISYSGEFPRSKYKPKAEFAQTLCTWSLVECWVMGKEVAWHNTELFDSTIFQLPYTITSEEKPLTQVKLSGFKNLESLLPFTDISFLSEETTIDNGLLKEFLLKFEINSRVDGYVYSQISSAELPYKIVNIHSEHKSAISKGNNIISIPVDVDELSTLINKQTENSPIEFSLYISNNRGWYCPNFICEIINEPSQIKRFEITTKNNYRAENFPEMKSKKRMFYHPDSLKRGDR